ncbi:MAG: DUF523 and DUF1722 domain-containing protein [Pseudohongiellaceae bacterium]|nr:DUF523 and DUF1722 domain-containing protein [Pseudohongiellaceae bacterium]
MELETEEQTSRILIGISSCLLGEKVRFDGQHQRHSYIEKTLGQYFEFRSFCPEVAIGLGIPRRPIRLVASGDDVRCVSTVDDTLDYTQDLEDAANEQSHWHADICGYILKKSSPSCGMERVKVYDGSRPRRDGVGIYAATLMNNFPDLPVEEEGRLGDAVLRENFIQRVYVTARWKKLLKKGITVSDLVEFHARHKLILMSHCQKTYRELGPLVANAKKDDIEQVSAQYFSKLMQALKVRATKGNQVNVLQHIQGYLKQYLDADDKAELSDAIAQYLRGQVPLIVPITLLNHYFRKHPNEYISNSWYMRPYPAELSLQNDI